MANYEYNVVIRDHKDAENGDFSPGPIIESITNPNYLCWSEYLNEVGEAFFSISQHDQQAMNLAYYPGIGSTNILSRRPHMEIYRNTRKVWGGWLGEIDETENDVIFYGYSYLSGFYDLLSPFVDKEVGKGVDFLVDKYFNMAKDKDGSRVHWFTEGIIQNPWTDDSQSVGLVMPLYKTSYKRILVIFKELAAYAISDTQNKVIFEVTPSGVFNLWRDRDSTNTRQIFSFPEGYVRSYRRVRRPALRRSKVVGVGASPTSVLNNAEATNGLVTSIGLSEEPLLFSYVRDQDELERVLASRVKRAGRVDSDFWISFYANTIVPFRGFEESVALGQDIKSLLFRGTSFGTNETKLVVGQQVVYHKQAENVRLLLADQL